MTVEEGAATAQRIMDKFGYVILLHSRGPIPVPIAGSILPPEQVSFGSSGAMCPVSLRVIGAATAEEFLQQCKYIGVNPRLNVRPGDQFFKVVAE